MGKKKSWINLGFDYHPKERNMTGVSWIDGLTLMSRIDGLTYRDSIF
jgi:hypothetical protein